MFNIFKNEEKVEEIIVPTVHERIQEIMKLAWIKSHGCGAKNIDKFKTMKFDCSNGPACDDFILKGSVCFGSRGHYYAANSKETYIEILEDPLNGWIMNNSMYSTPIPKVKSRSTVVFNGETYRKDNWVEGPWVVKIMKVLSEIEEELDGPGYYENIRIEDEQRELKLEREEKQAKNALIKGWT